MRFLLLVVALAIVVYAAREWLRFKAEVRADDLDWHARTRRAPTSGYCVGEPSSPALAQIGGNAGNSQGHAE